MTGLVPAWAVACAGLLASLGSCGLAAKAESPLAVAKDARVAGDRERTRFIADLSKKVDVHVFALGNPYRVIVDAPDVSFQMPNGIGKEKRGLVTAYRYGLFAPGKARIVIDVSGPFLIDKAFVLELEPWLGLQTVRAGGHRQVVRASPLVAHVRRDCERVRATT